MKAAVYCRVSTDDQTERGTIDIQTQACRAFCEQRGYEVIGEYRDDGVSGAKPVDERPEGKRLLSDATAKLFETVVVYRLDRLSRDTLGALQAIKQLEKSHVKVESMSESFDDSPMGIYMQQNIFGMAQLERAMIFDRTSKGRLRNIKEGRLYQSPIVAFGYRRTENKLIEPDPATAPVVQQVFEWAKSGLGSKVIAQRLDAQGVKPPMIGHPKREGRYPSWNWSTVHKILRNSRYIGQGSYNGILMKCPAIVSDELFLAVQEALPKHRADSKRGTLDGREYLLQHVVYCGVCGGRYTPRTAPNGYVSYACFRRTVDGDAKTPHDPKKWRFPGTWLERKALNFIKETIWGPDATWEDFEFEAPDDEGDAVAAATMRLETAEKTLATLEAQRQRLIALCARGVIGEDDLEKQLGELGRERTATQETADAARWEIAHAANANERATSWAAWIRENAKDGEIRVGPDDLELMPFDAKRELLRKVIDSLTITDTPAGVKFAFKGIISRTFIAEPNLLEVDFTSLKAPAAGRQTGRVRAMKPLPRTGAERARAIP